MSRKGKARNPSCGFCSDGFHERCVINIPLSQRISLWRCECECNTEDRRRCMDCNRREDQAEVSRETGRCVDSVACREYRDARIQNDPAAARMAQIYAEVRGSYGAAIAPERKAPRPRKTRACLCCGEETKGGNFRPGHDSKFVSLLVSETTDDNRATQAERAAQVSQAILRKYESAIARAVKA